MADDVKLSAYGGISPRLAHVFVHDILTRRTPPFVETMMVEIMRHAPKPGVEIVGPPRPPRCDECRFCAEEDTGHSCWSVDGVIADCMLGLNPGLPEDSFYGQEPVLAFAEKCGRFSRGDGPHIDCDGDVDGVVADPEIRDLFAAWRKKNGED